ncbi:hypothetical protein Poli38472_002841 [Pythium oligandrum]|uniref:Uncharacterized protein n=1 Tax=Pythium oligandrum TaxID=41045 RepID=A0A8K1C5F6_PYTOL|nr:hypothetical protein Poli38472_002841 [Pythium oligandrum]|eukprot:TMW56916.1 hypothetical protein Poli38472_002841 [Pythium oligandrum]
MELRNRAGFSSRRDDRGQLRDVALGPTVYAGERYGKMSERLKRQQRNAPDVNQTANRLLTPRLVGFVLALIVFFSVIFILQYQAAQRRNRRKGV